MAVAPGCIKPHCSVPCPRTLILSSSSLNSIHTHTQLMSTTKWIIYQIYSHQRRTQPLRLLWTQGTAVLLPTLPCFTCLINANPPLGAVAESPADENAPPYKVGHGPPPQLPLPLYVLLLSRCRQAGRGACSTRKVAGVKEYTLYIVPKVD